MQLDMAKARSPPFFLLFITLTTMLVTPPSLSEATSPPPAKALVAPITKDTFTSLYSISLSNKPYVLDLAGPLLWSLCQPHHPTVPCNASACGAANSYHPPHCPRIFIPIRKPCTCIASPTNPVTGTCAFGELTLTNLTLSSTNGKNPTGARTFCEVVASCAPASLLQKLPSGTAGVAGFAQSAVSLPSQLTSKMSSKKQFGICLPSGGEPGVAFFGNEPFYLITILGIELTSLLQYTPLVKNHNNPGYYLKVKGIAVNTKGVPLSPWLLELDWAGNGGVKIDTAVPYTTLKTQIYQPILGAFDRATSGIPRMPKVKPFDLCLNSSALGSTRVGYGVAPIDVMLEGGKNWTIFGSNSLKQVSDNTACLAFVDGGRTAEQAIVFGGYQMENNFFLFDLAQSRLGFSSTLFGIMTTCSNFNFTLGT